MPFFRAGGNTIYLHVNLFEYLTLTMLNLDLNSFGNNVVPDQLASEKPATGLFKQNFSV